MPGFKGIFRYFVLVIVSVFLLISLFLIAHAAWISGNLSNSAAQSQRPDIDCDSYGNVYVVWSEKSGGSNYNPYYSRFDGTSWSGGAMVTGRVVQDIEVACRPNSTQVHAVWWDEINGSARPEIYFMKREDWGSGSPTKISRATSTLYARWPDVDLDSSGNTHVIWCEYDSGAGNATALYYRRGTSNGSSWGSFYPISTSSVPLGINYKEARIAAGTSTYVHAVFTKIYYGTPATYEVNYVRSTDSGTNWSSLVPISFESGYPDIAADSLGNVHVVWGHGNDIFYRKGTSNGSSWTGGITNISSYPAAASLRPAITTDKNDDLHVFWQDGRDGGSTYVYYSKSTDSGSTWSDPSRISTVSIANEFPRAASDPLLGCTDVVWQSGFPIDEIYYAFEEGSIKGSVDLNPAHNVSLEVEASKNGRFKSKAERSGEGVYEIFGLRAGTYSLEVHAPGYELKANAPASVEAGVTREGVDLSVNAAWPQFKEDERNTSDSPDTLLVAPLALKWSYKTSGEIYYSSPTIVNGTVYIGSMDSRLYAISESGAFQWSFVSGGMIYSSPAYYEGKIYFGTRQDYKLFAVNDDGTLSWSYRTGHEIRNSPVVSNGIIYIGSQDSKLYAIKDNGSSPQPLWSYTMGDMIIFASPAASDGVIYIGSSDSKLYALRDDGVLMWSYQAGSVVNSAPCISGNRLYVTCADGKIYNLTDNGSTATLNWSTASLGMFQVPASVVGSRIFARTSLSGRLHVLEDIGSTYSYKWSFVIGTDVRSSPTIANGVVYFGGQDNKIFGLLDKGTSYEIRWSYETDGNVASSPSVLNGSLYVGSYDSTIYAFETAGSIRGDISLDPAHAVSVEVEASINGKVMGRAVIIGQGQYVIEGLGSGTYSVEAHAPGYEIGVYPGGVSVTSGTSTEGIDFSLDAAWPMFHQDRWRTGNSPDTELVPPLVLKWSFPAGGIIDSSPAAVGGIIYLGAKDKNLYAIQDNGIGYTFKWSFPAGGLIDSSPAVVNGIIYFGSSDNNLYAVQDNGSSYTFKWSFPTGDTIDSSPVVVNGIIYVGSHDSKLYAIQDNGSSYTFKWSFPTGASIFAPAAAADGTVYIGSCDNNFYAIQDNGSSYTFKWSFPTGDNVYPSPAVVNGIIYFGSYDSNLYAIQDNGSGYTFKWSFPAGDSIFSCPAVVGGIIYFGSRDSKLYAIQDNGSSYTFKWSFPTGHAVDSSPVVADGIIYFGSSDSNFYAIQDNGSGYTLRWSFLTGHYIGASPAAADGTIYITSWDKNLYAFETPGSISGRITLTPNSSERVEITVLSGSGIAGSAEVTGSGLYSISPLHAGSYSVEAHAPGYEMKLVPVQVQSGASSNIDFSLGESWPQYMGSKYNTGRSPDRRISPPIDLLWSFETSRYITSSPVVVNGILYIGSADNSVYAINDDGTMRWSYETGYYIRDNAASVLNGVVYIGSWDGNFYALGADDGSFIWSFDSGDYFDSPSTISNGIIYAGSYNHNLYAFRQDGTVKWSYDTGGAPIRTNAPAVTDSTVYLLPGDLRLHAIRSSDGAFKWSFPTGWFIDSSPMVDDNTIYFGSQDNKLYAIQDNETSPSVKWSLMIQEDINSTPIASNGVIFFGSRENYLFAVNDNGSSASYKWSFLADDDINNPSAVADGVVYFGTSGGTFYGVSEEGGTLLWSYPAGAVNHSGPAVADGKIYVASWNNKIYAFKYDHGWVQGSVFLNPSRSVTVEVCAYANGVIGGSDMVVGGGSYHLELPVGTYSLEAHAAGYEVKPLGSVVITSNSTSSAGSSTLNSAWPMFQQDRRHTGNAPSSGINPPLSLKWSCFVGERSDSPLTVSGGMIYVAGESSGDIYAVSSTTGSILMSYAGSGLNEDSAPMVYGDRIYVGKTLPGGAGGLVESFVVGQSGLLWSFTAGGTVESSPVESYGSVYFGSFDNNVYAINAYSGDFRWSYRTGNAILSSPAVNGENVYVGSFDSKVYALSASDGTLVWSYEGGAGFRKDAAPCVADGRLYIVCPDSTLYALDEASGDLNWAYDIGDWRDSTPAVSGGKVLLAVDQSIYDMRAFNAQTGAFLWSTFNSTGTLHLFNDAPAVASGVVYFSGTLLNIPLQSPGFIRAADLQNGNLLWSHYLGPQSGITNPPVISNDVLYVMSNDSHLYAFEGALPTSEGFQVSNLRISREADSAGSAVILTWDPTSEVDVWSTTEGYTSWEGWVMEGSTTESRWHDPNQVGAGDDEKYYKVVLHNVGATAIGSADAVGKVNIHCFGEDSYTPVSIPFIQQYGNDWDNVIGDQLVSGASQSTSDQIYSYDGAGYASAEYLSSTGGWTNIPGFQGFDNQIGFGYFVYIQPGNPSREVTVVGKVSTVEVQTTILGNDKYTFIGNPFPIKANLDDVDFTGNSGANPSVADQLWLYNAATGSFSHAEYFNTAGWTNISGFSSFDLEAGRGYFYYVQPGASGYNWQYDPYD